MSIALSKVYEMKVMLEPLTAYICLQIVNYDESDSV